MFCDLVGSTALSARLIQRICARSLPPIKVRQARSCAVSVALSQYMGDGVLVFFGYPRAHEDDAEAVQPGWIVAAMEANTPPRCKPRVGIATGLVVVGDLVGGGSQERGSSARPRIWRHGYRALPNRT